ncbi:polyprenyl synthetase family protein [Arachnia propionica]|uniref:Polyprenyl synthetase family protein n=1 Tax=Arachnia propionica TaxID=1750 RepID=A0A3P1T2S1_9ACTN|nr:polyprenyl synthetase family protein [Arachnia propionica]
MTGVVLAEFEALSARFEEELRRVAVADSPFVTETATHLIAAGGKRFRPMLVFLASRFGGEADEERLLKAAMVMELTHVASLYHDDVMDEAEVRRAAPSANSRWGNSIAILAGDYLFAKASILVADLGTEYVRLQAETFTRLVQGQINETRGPADGEDRLEHHVQVLADKTGSLIAASALFGAMVAGAPVDAQQALAAYGEEVGLVFQLSDDIIDITSDVTGKTPGTDLREGVPTLPTLLLAASDDPQDAELKQLLAGDLSSDEALAAAVAALRSHRVIEEARAEVRRRAELAKAHLAPLPEGEAKELLIKVCDDLVTRSA